MILATVFSINNVPIRLTEERFEHILKSHAELSYSDLDMILEAVENPEYILTGYGRTLVAVALLGKANYLHVVYKELSREDGFIITAGIRPAMSKKRIIWRR